jgi:GntR family transcriptional regulator
MAATAAQQLKRDGGPALYLQVADQFRLRITEGVWNAGDRIPALDMLMDEFQVSRVTLRDAVRVLASDGLLEPARGRGTIVTDRAKGHRTVQIQLGLNSFLDTLRGDRPDLANVEQATVLPDLSQFDGVPADSYEFLKRAHLREGVRYCLISLHLDRRLFEQAPHRFQNELVLPVMHDLFPEQMFEFSQKMRFGKCPRDLAEALQYPYGDPVAYVTRLIRNRENRIVYQAEVSYRADLLELKIGDGL